MSAQDLSAHKWWVSDEASTYRTNGLLIVGFTAPQIKVDQRNFSGDDFLAYLATPYSKRAAVDGRFDKRESDECAEDAALFAARFARAGITAISPIVQAVSMASYSEIDPLDASFWARWCNPILCSSQCVIVPPIHGWAASDGVLNEVKAALSLDKIVYAPDSSAVWPDGLWLNG